MLHVWDIYLHLGHFWGKCSFQYSSTIEHLGYCISPYIILIPIFIIEWRNRKNDHGSASDTSKVRGQLG